MALLNDMSRCPGIGCPSKETCRRFPGATGRIDPGQHYAALYVRRDPDADACDEYLPRPQNAEEAGDA